MVELYLMASHGGYPPGLGAVFHPDQVLNRGLKDSHHFIPYQGSNQDLVSSHSFNLSLQQKEEWRSTGGLFDCNHFLRIDSNSRRPAVIDFQETHPEPVHFSFGIAEQCMRQEKISKLLTLGSIEEEEDGLVDLSMPYDMTGSRYLIYPNREFYYNEPCLDLMGDRSCSTFYPDGQLQYNCTGIEMNDMLSVMSEFYLLNNTTKSSKQTLLVPYFERRRRARANTNASKLASEKVGSQKSHEKVKDKASHKKKTITKERDIYCNSTLHACESLLSIIVDRQKQRKNVVLSLKKTGPQLPQFLTQCSASIAGMGIAVVLSVLCRVACSRVPFCASKLLSTGLGLGLVWLSSAVNKLSNTVTSISRSSGKSCAKEVEMMNNLDRNLKDICFRAAALMAVAVLRLA
ncbi:hypothetical protein BUALT_Bualt02G0224200 [Buddleja alternifolia]|uniref:Uncharacterized protein n=1 Tax=Buddleja alternifolia TaxID=168488 RepID=A0AAV6Y6M3_9LAMI|nr:hypothetical protein BUALT_Bualt02G0224200 [Buddleja alternifolia]